MDQNRRDFIKFSLASASLTALPFPFISKALAGDFRDDSPIQVLNNRDLFSTDFNGDDIHRTHDTLWDLGGFIKKRGGIPKPSEKANVVIIGGGLSGLTAAYFLKDLNPIVLEQDQFFGGNAKGEQFGDSTYTIGSTYITEPEEGSDVEGLLKDLGIWNLGRKETGAEAHVFFQDKLFRGFWQGVTDTTARNQFKTIFEDLKKINDSGLADSIYDGKALSAEFKNLDGITFETWLKKNYGEVHPHILEYFQLYAWSSFAASLSEISAAQMLSFIAAETGDIIAFPGGNAAITQALYKDFLSRNKRSSLRSASIVVDVRVTNDGVEICYDDQDKVLRTIKAKTCIFAAPKFVAKKVIQNLSDSQIRAMEQITYRSYIVANIILTNPISEPCFEMYCLKGENLPTPSAMRPPKRGFTDLCFATWVQKSSHGVLSVYHGMAYDGARQFLFSPGSHDKYRERILNEVEPIMTGIGLNKQHILGVRLTRWGHSLPVAQQGLLKSGIAEASHQPVGNRIFFANQDNWANPCFETGFAEAKKAAEQVRSVLG